MSSIKGARQSGHASEQSADSNGDSERAAQHASRAGPAPPAKG